MSVKAAVVREYGKPFEVKEVILPSDLGPNDVRVEIKVSGLCHSDVSVQTGGLPFPLPMIVGHEGAGIVKEVGSAVTNVKPGDRVVLSAVISCGQCRMCLKGRPNLCEWGLPTIFGGKQPDGEFRARDVAGNDLYQFSSIGTLAGELICSDRAAIPFPDDVPFEIAALVGCGVLTGLSAVFNNAKVAPGDTVGVIGCGGVGLNVVQGAQIAGASRIIAIDVHDEKLQMARDLGATDLVNSSVDNPVAKVMELTGERGVDYSFEVVGLPDLFRQAWDMLAMDGTLIGIGVAAADSTVELPAFEFSTSEKSLKGCLYGTSRPTQDIALYIEMYRQGKLELDHLVSHRYSIDQINEATEAMHAGTGARGVIVF